MTIIETIVVYALCGVGFVVGIGSILFFLMFLWAISQQ